MGIMEKYDVAKFTLDIGVNLCMLYNLLGQKFRNYDLNILVSILYLIIFKLLNSFTSKPIHP